MHTHTREKEREKERRKKGRGEGGRQEGKKGGREEEQADMLTHTSFQSFKRDDGPTSQARLLSFLA